MHGHHGRFSAGWQVHANLQQDTEALGDGAHANDYNMAIFILRKHLQSVTPA